MSERQQVDFATRAPQLSNQHGCLLAVGKRSWSRRQSAWSHFFLKRTLVRVATVVYISDFFRNNRGARGVITRREKIIKTAMGDKSPKSTQKKASQKATKTTAANKKKQQVAASKQGAKTATKKK